MKKSDRTRVIFFGTPVFSVPTLTALVSSPKFDVRLVVTQPDRPKGRGGSVFQSPVKEYAVKSGIPVLQPLRIKNEIDDFISESQKFGPFDVGIVIAFGQILPKKVLDLPRFGCLNLHGSILPRWRGAAPIQRAILAGDKFTGVCLMKMDEGMDTGAVFSSEEIAILPTDSYETLHDRLAKLSAELLVRDIDRVLSAELSPQPQSSLGVTYAAKVTPTEALLNWNESAELLSNKIRAFNPAPGAYSYLLNRRFKIFEAAPVARMNASLELLPGQLSLVDKGRLEVRCGGEKDLALLSVQLEGKKRMTIVEFVKGTPLKIGDKLGDN